MLRREDIRGTVFTMMALDVFLLALIVVASFPAPMHFAIMASIYLPAVLVFNLLFLRRKRRVVSFENGGVGTRKGRLSLFICSALFFSGGIHGFLKVLQGEMSWVSAPFLLIPLFVAAYCLKTAWHVTFRNSS